MRYAFVNFKPSRSFSDDDVFFRGRSEPDAAEIVICSGAGFKPDPAKAAILIELQHECLHCGRKTLFLPRAPEASDKDGFRLEGYPPAKHVVEAKDWDGSDWFECGGVPFVSSNAKEWLEKTHTHPVDIRPALLNVEGVAVKGKS